jgi:long-subunit acyl-CoA synthetase (AMP-forming)
MTNFSHVLSDAQAITSLEAGHTVAMAVRHTARARGEAPAFRNRDGTLQLSWAQTLERTDRLAAGLHSLGVRPGDVVAVMLANRPEFAIADLAILTLGAAGFSLYATLPPEQMAAQLENSGTRVVICEPVFLATVRAARDLIAGAIEHVVVLDDDDHAGTTSWRSLEVHGDGFDAEAAAAGVDLDDLATLIYTSGTTGPAKGVELTHRNLLESARTINSVVGLQAGDRVISWLPNAHIAERIAHHYLPVLVGVGVTSCADSRQIAATLQEVRPKWFFSVPRVWEKLRAGIEARLAGLPPAEREPIQAALSRQIERVRLAQAQQTPTAELAARAAADAELVAGLRAGLGLDEASCLQAGAAPCPSEVVEFFHAIGLPLTEIWGMSETTAAGAMGRQTGHRIGTVGQALPGIELRLAEDGELLVRGPVVMRGYRRRPEETAEALRDGWLHTGDIATIDDDGCVTIVDRKKDLIINSAGKNMSPANIEAALKSAGPLIGQACVVGDGRPFNVALLVLDPDTASAWARNAGLDGDRSMAELSRDPVVVEAMEAEVAAANARLSRVEQIKKFVIVASEWQPGGTELTPTMKLKRAPIAEKYHDAIEALYA